MSSETECKKLGRWKGTPPSLTAYVGGAALAFFLCLQMLSRVYAHLTSADLVFQTLHGSTLKLVWANSLIGEGGSLSKQSPRPQSLGTVLLEPSNGTRDLADHLCQYGICPERRNGITKQGRFHSQQTSPCRSKEGCNPDPGGLFQLRISANASSKDEELTNHVVRRPLEILANWSGDLDGVDLRYLLRKLTAQERKLWLSQNLARFKILQSDAISDAFPKRMHCFFNNWNEPGCGYEKSFTGGKYFSDGLPQENESARTATIGIRRRRNKCEIRVFMTWIFPLSSFGPREQLSLESVFKTYPDACLAIFSRSLDSEEGLLLMYPFLNRGFRIMAVSPDVPFLLKDTPALHWFEGLQKGAVDPGEISLSQNLSNLLRLAALYKYGGVYLDSDVILLRKFPALDHVLGAQSVDPVRKKWTRINNAVMIFGQWDPTLFKFIEEFARTFNGSKWGHNGPYLVTRVWRRLVHRPGYECSVLPPLAFYPVNWVRVGEFLKSPTTELESRVHAAKMRKIRSESFALHLWNKQSRELAVERGSIVDVIFRQRCIVCDEGVLNAALRSQRRN